jgi:hypothetical protein
MTGSAADHQLPDRQGPAAASYRDTHAEPPAHPFAGATACRWADADSRACGYGQRYHHGWENHVEH